MLYAGNRESIGREGFEPSRGCPQRILSPLRLPFRHRPTRREERGREKAASYVPATSPLFPLSPEATVGFEPTIRVLQTPALTTWLRRLIAHDKEATACAVDLGRAGEGIRTLDLLLGKETFYH